MRGSGVVVSAMFDELRAAIVDWTAQGADGQARGAGTNVFGLAPDGRIERIIGF